MTGWSKVTQYNNNKASTAVILVGTMCLYRYHWPSEITYDCGSELLGHEIKNTLIEEECIILAKTATRGNPQANSIIKRIHQLLANLIHIFELEKICRWGWPMEGNSSVRSFCNPLYISYNQQKFTWITIIWEINDCINWTFSQLQVNIPT